MAWIDQGNLPKGYWGDITSSLVWCEEKYYFSKYLAEPVNTLTNIYMITLGILGAKFAWDQRMPFRFVLAYLGGTLIGIGSFAFHATLKYQAQLLDELPMIYTTAVYLYCVMETTPGYGKPRFAILLPFSLLAFVTFVTVAYVYNNNPVFHQVAYAAMQVVGTIQVTRLLNDKRNPAKLSKSQRKDITRQFSLGTALFLLAFAVWNVDNIFCSQLRSIRRSIGYPAALLLEGHGWWHIGTGLGAYMIIAASQRLVLSTKEGTSDNFSYRYILGIHPYVVRVKPYRPIANSTSKTNGKAQIKAAAKSK